VKVADNVVSPTDTPRCGLTPREVAKLLRVNADRVRGWIKSGELRALNVATARCGRPRFVIYPTTCPNLRAAWPPPRRPSPRRGGKRGKISSIFTRTDRAEKMGRPFPEGRK